MWGLQLLQMRTRVSQFAAMLKYEEDLITSFLRRDDAPVAWEHHTSPSSILSYLLLESSADLLPVPVQTSHCSPSSSLSLLLQASLISPSDVCGELRHAVVANSNIQNKQASKRASPPQIPGSLSLSPWGYQPSWRGTAMAILLVQPLMLEEGL